MQKQQTGFTLIEMMIVVALIGILAAIAYPSYQRYVIKTKRTDAMTYLQNQASQIESKKLAMGGYSTIPAASLPSGNYPQSGTALYNIATDMDGNDDGTQGDWIITATPIATAQMTNDGTLSLNAQGVKCRARACGVGNEWNN